MFKEFDLVEASNKEVLIWYFREVLKPFIQAQIDSRHQKLDFWDKMLDEAIEAKFKAAFQSGTSICKMDACC